jgi:hypothetical protein
MFAFFKNTLAAEGIDEPCNRPAIAWALLIAILAMAIRVLFWCYTGRVWEDTLITVLHSENCAQGLGLTHHASEPRVHGFTSPLSVLVPLAADVVHVGWGIPFIKLVSIFCGALSVFYVMAISIHPHFRLAAPLAVMAMGFVAFEHHHVFFGMSGMETQMVTLVLLMSIYYIIADRPVHLGISLGLCMLARPDFGFWTIIVGLYLLCRRPKRLLTVVPVALCVYGPWIVFTTLYYGSPIPNTLLAKMLGYSQWWKDPNLTWIDAKRTFIDNLVYHVLAQTGPTHLGHAFPKGTFFWDKRVISNAVVLLAAVGAVAAVLKRRWELIPPGRLRAYLRCLLRPLRAGSVPVVFPAAYDRNGRFVRLRSRCGNFLDTCSAGSYASPRVRGCTLSGLHRKHTPDNVPRGESNTRNCGRWRAETDRPVPERDDEAGTDARV